MAGNMIVERGMVRKVAIAKKVFVPATLASVATNHAGWEVQQYNRYHGWARVPGLPIVQSQGVAEMMRDEVQSTDLDTEYRVYESLNFPVKQ
jgi:hypothetical protein